MRRHPSEPIIYRGDDPQEYIEQLEARLAEFEQKYRGQIANDGSYPDHLFTPDSATPSETGGQT